MTRGACIGSLALILGAGLALMILGLLFPSEAAALMGVMNVVHGQAIVYIQLRAGAPWSR